MLVVDSGKPGRPLQQLYIAAIMVVSIEEVSSSLVREYLSRKGLRRTIACMDEEHPRTDDSINNRSELRQILHMDGLYKKNKAQKEPLKTMLEIIVKHHIGEHKNDKIAFNNDTVLEESTIGIVSRKPNTSRSFKDKDCPQGRLLSPEADRHSTHNQTGSWGDNPEGQKEQQLVASLQGNESFTRTEPEKTATTESAQKNRMNRIRRGMMPGPIANSHQESNKKRQTRRAGVPHPLLGNEEDNGPSKDGPSVTSLHQESLESGLTEHYTTGSIRERQQFLSTPEREKSKEGFKKVRKDMKTRKAKSLPNQNVDGLHVSEMILDDIDYDEELQELSKMSFQASVPQHSYESRPMNLLTAIALKEVLLGSSSTCFSVEWRNQGFTFSETRDLRYGIVQKKGGPCGVLASIQACVLKKLLFDGTESSYAGLETLRPSNTTRRQGLISAAAEVLWRAGDEKQSTLAISSGRNHFIPAGHYKSEGVLEKITCFTVDNLEDLQSLLEQHIQQFESGALGCILLTISAVLSRAVEKVRADMDVPTTTLIGAHGYCTQELVNLLLCGRAVSNVFDNDMELDSGNGNLTLLKGIKGRCDIGLLSLFEHYNICKVGTNLKTPQFPIWVVCSESHFSVLFGLQRELLTNQDRPQEFDLYFYDGLANQQEEIRLTVSVGMLAQSSQDVDHDLIPPLEHCIRTKWRDAVVSWNNTEPIL
ncbi:putative ubiquitin carboxyl-terminal hydrolase MINDY-4 [Polymixia lowei]